MADNKEKERIKVDKVYGPDGDLISKTIHKYDETGRMIEKEIYDLEREIYEYDFNNISQNMTGTDSSLKYPHFTFRYDERGNIIEEIEHFYSHPGEMGTKYYYNSENKLIKKTDLMYTTTYKYNEKGNVVEENGFINGGKDLDDDKLSYTTTYKYDIAGNKIEENTIHTEDN